MPETNARIKVCHDTAANFKTNNPTLLVGEWALETDTKKMKIGDGSTVYNALPYSTAEDSDEWIKPSDWIDIRSGAIDNSIYLLVGHSANYSSLNNLGFVVTLNDNTHNFNVYIDNVFYQTYQSGSTVEISWRDLALTTGKNTTFPIDLTTHIVRITPENNSDTIYSYKQVRANASSGEQVQGVLWGHFAVDYALDRVQFVSYNNCYNYYLVAVTALGDNLHISGNVIENLFGDVYDRANYKSHYLSYIPTIEMDTLGSWGGAFNNAGPLKKVRLKVNTKIQQTGSGSTQQAFMGDIRKWEINKPILLSNRNIAVRLFASSSLERLPAFDATNMVNGSDFLTNNSNLKDTILDFSNAKNLQRLTLYGTASNRMDGLKGVFVSDQAPFNHTTSPQLDVSYTGLDRAALVNLFKSMPYNVGYTLVGTPTIVNGVASGFSDSDYLKLTAALGSFNSLEIKTKFKPTSLNTSRIVATTGGSSNYNGIVVTSTGIIRGAVYNGTSLVSINSSIAYEAGNTYYAILKRDGDTLSLAVSTDNSNYTVDTIQVGTTGTIETDKNVYIGVFANTAETSFTNPFNGEIDLNETYIKVNGVPWFTGKAAMTKTCDVRGCTGTADLTQTDKDIALDKGWSLTVA